MPARGLSITRALRMRVGAPALSTQITFSSDAPRWSDETMITVTVSNVGNIPAQGAQVLLVLPFGLRRIANDEVAGDFAIRQLITATRTLNPGESMTLEIPTRLDPFSPYVAQSFEIAAFVTSQNGDTQVEKRWLMPQVFRYILPIAPKS
jgi:uncharacterized repeat protein (TIGR01451 family)